MSIQTTITITGSTKAELLASAANVIAMLGGADAPAPLTAAEQSRLRADATVVPPKADKAADKKKAAAEKKAAEEAAKKAAQEVLDEGVDGEAETTADDDALDEGGTEEELTTEDVKNLLLEVRKAYPTKNTIISEIVKEHGKAAKISEVDAKHLPAVAKKARELLAKAKK